MLTSIIMPFFNRWELTHARLMEFYKHLSAENIEVILINDASTEPDCETGTAWWQKNVKPFPILYHKNKENVGFGHSMNNGAKIANGEVLVFYSNDVVLSGNFIPELSQLLAKNEKVLVGNEVIWFPGGWNEFNVNGKHVVIPYANGWFIACKRDIWVEIGGFDWKTFGRMDYEDMDVSVRAYELGYNVVALNSKKIAHAHQGSTVETLKNFDRMAHTKQNRIKFIAKWADKLTDISVRLEEMNGQQHKEGH